MPATPRQRIWQGRFEALIGIAAPAFDLLLNAGDRASRLLLPDDSDYYPIRPAAEAFELDEARKRNAQVD
jgi:hypothetical protein